MTKFLGDGRRSRLGVAAPLTALAVCAASLVLTAPAHAGTAHAGTSTSTAAGTRAPRIVGGTPADINKTPWAVQLIYTPGGGSSDFCAGTLIAPTKVLTAGYCVAGRDWTTSGKVVVNSQTVGGGSGSITVGVRAQWVQPDYQLAADGRTADNDLAMLTLDQPITTNYEWLTEPWQTNLYEPGLNPTTIYGWGNTSSAPGSSNAQTSLHSATLDVDSDATCATALDTATGNPHAYVPGHMICVGAGGTGDDTTGKTACVGDVGGPVDTGTLIGVVSHLGIRTGSQDCNVPGTYDVVTKVTTYYADIIHQVFNSDVTRDGKADILARTPAGASYVYASTGSGYKSRVPAPISFKNYNTVVQADLDADGYQDYILRAAGTGNVFVAKRTVKSATYKYTQIGANWKAVKAITVPGDVDGNRYPDLEVEDSSGRMWTYSGAGNGLFGKPIANQANLKRFNTVVGHGDFTNDGIQDLIGRDAKSGDLYLIPGTPDNQYIRYLAPIRISAGWKGYDKLLTVGDYNGDGHPDLLARTPSGALFLFKGTGHSGPTTFTSAVKLGTGWNTYNLLS